MIVSNILIYLIHFQNLWNSFLKKIAKQGRGGLQQNVILKRILINYSVNDEFYVYIDMYVSVAQMNDVYIWLIIIVIGCMFRIIDVNVRIKLLIITKIDI